MGHSFTELLARIIVPALQTTLYMVAIATICSAILGFSIAVLLYITRKSDLASECGRVRSDQYNCKCDSFFSVCNFNGFHYSVYAVSCGDEYR